jgi:glucose/mannose transport system substrate-binding protein
MRRTFGAVLGLLAACSGLIACSSSSEPVQSTDQELEVLNWWTNPGETDALAKLIDLYQAKYPQTHVTNAAVDTITKAQEQLQTRMAAGTPPDTLLSIGGWNLKQWVAYNGQNDADSKMDPVDSILDAAQLKSVTPKSVIDAVSYNGKAYEIPLAIHRFNTLFYNKKLLADNGLNPPSTLDEFYQVGDALKAKGIVPLALGSKDGFYLSILAWDGVLIAKGGAAFRESFFSGTADPGDPRVVDTLNEVNKMFDYTNDDRDSMTWDGAAQMVVDGKAAMTVMGDWAKGFFLSKGWKPDVELGSRPTPGTQGVFVYIVDGFALPKGVQNHQAAVNFLDLVGSAETQATFNPIKGAIPPRTDVDKSKFDALAQLTMTDFQGDTLTSARPAITKNPAFLGQVDAAMKQFAIDRNVDTVVNVLKNRYDELK